MLTKTLIEASVFAGSAEGCSDHRTSETSRKGSCPQCRHRVNRGGGEEVRTTPALHQRYRFYLHACATLTPRSVQLYVSRRTPAYRYVLQTYARPNMVLTSGQGCKLYDAHGKEYLDFAAGIAVNALGELLLP